MRLSVDVYEQGLDSVYLGRGEVDRLLLCMSHNNYYVYLVASSTPYRGKLSLPYPPIYLGQFFF